MQTQGTNLYIVDDDKLMLSVLKAYFSNRFGSSLNVSTFEDGDSCLKKINKKTNIVILDYFMEGKNGLEVLKSIKERNPNTEVIMLSSNEDMALAIETFRNGAKDYVVKGPTSWGKLTGLVDRIITEPIKAMVREFGVPKFMAIFFAAFTAMGIVVYSVLKIIS
jgi:DNA-binding NtrC family response regulator